MFGWNPPLAAARHLWGVAAAGIVGVSHFIGRHPRLILVPLSVAALLEMPGDARRISVRQAARPHVTRSSVTLAYPPGFHLPPLRVKGKPPQSALVIKVGDAKPLYDLNGDEPRYPASTTKLMTLYLLFQEMKAGHISPDKMLTISPHADSMPPSILVVPGHKISAYNAAMTIITRSANNIAVAVGEAIAGSEPAFAVRMNATAKKLGLRQTFYFNASGLPDARRDNVTSARDLATLAAAIERDFPAYAKWFDTPVYTYFGTPIRNHNHLVGKDHITGMKTGFINKSGYNVVTSYEPPSGNKYIVVVIGSRSWVARDHTAIDLACKYIPEFAHNEAKACATPETAVKPAPSAAPVPLTRLVR
ncbi:MAG: serine hydrolase [Alphaproteobacteria bacterium]|nr:serine hydrolase [Alphaproteobacteria bacterium]